jgi:ADP-ribosylglycohydrolase
LAVVSLALALAVTGSARAILAATNVGGDSDSVASIAGGIAGAIDSASVLSNWSRIVEEVNGLDLRSVAAAIAVVRL